MNNKIIFEVMPYPKTASESYANKITDKIVNAVNEMEKVSIINIPEIVEENHIGQPYYRNIDARKFGKELGEKCNKEIMVNTVVVHHKSKGYFEQWLGESIDKYGVKNFVFVGAKIPTLKYPGPSVPEANLIAKSKNVNFGNIFIPDRPNEADRLVEKTKAGCKFFTSQVLFEADAALSAIKQYTEKCKSNELKPSKFYLSFAPISSEDDLIFIKWLGAEISKETESRLKKAEDMGQESISAVLELIEKILNSNKKNSNAEIGLNIGYVMLHNLDFARDLVKNASPLLN